MIKVSVYITCQVGPESGIVPNHWVGRTAVNQVNLALNTSLDSLYPHVVGDTRVGVTAWAFNQSLNLQPQPRRTHLYAPVTIQMCFVKKEVKNLPGKPTPAGSVVVPEPVTSIWTQLQIAVKSSV